MGDVDLNQSVEFSDFLALSSGFGQAGGWAEGDSDGNGQVEFPDFLALSANFGNSNSAAAAVPEPAGMHLAWIGLIACLGMQRRMRRKK